MTAGALKQITVSAMSGILNEQKNAGCAMKIKKKKKNGRHLQSKPVWWGFIVKWIMQDGKDGVAVRMQATSLLFKGD